MAIIVKERGSSRRKRYSAISGGTDGESGINIEAAASESAIESKAKKNANAKAPGSRRAKKENRKGEASSASGNKQQKNIAGAKRQRQQLKTVLCCDIKLSRRKHMAFLGAAKRENKRRKQHKDKTENRAAKG
jgi:hypothetical protein